MGFSPAHAPAIAAGGHRSAELTMQMVRVAADSPTDLPSRSIVCHDVRDPEQRSEVLVRKGTWLRADEIRPLLARGVRELHLAVPDPGDVGEDQAAARLAAAVAGRAVECGEARFGQVTFTSAARAMLRIDPTRLNLVNAQDDVLLLTAEADRPVDVGDALGVVKCAPVFLSESALRAVERVAIKDGPVLQLEPFRPMRVAMVAPRERLRGGAFDRARTALAQALGWYGSTLNPVIGAEASADSLAAAYGQAVSDGVDLILAAGAAGTDPLDIVFDGLRRAGGQVEQIGIPAEPGTACWIGHVQSTPVLGLASCELFGQPGALDLLLPRLLTGEVLDRRLLSRLALGGLLLGPSRVAPYHNQVGDAD
jgi:molybdenum cofactor cytidylyltransferase